MSLFPGNHCYGAILSGNERHMLREWHCRVRKMMIDLNQNEASANSNYYEELDLEATKRYDVKFATLGNLGDPYAARKKPSTSLEWQNWPSVEYPDISESR